MIGTFKVQVILLFEMNNPFFLLYMFMRKYDYVHMEVSTIKRICHVDLILSDMMVLFGILKRRKREERKGKEKKGVIGEGIRQ